jgi:hypothetical protein
MNKKMVEKKKEFIWFMILVAGRPKQYGADLVVRILQLCHSSAENQRGNWLHGEGLRLGEPCSAASWALKN